MARSHKLCGILYFFHILLFISSISSLNYDANGVPVTLQDFDGELAIFSTVTDELNVSVAVARGRHFGSLFPSTRRRRFHQARVIYYSNSCATFNLEYLLTCGDVQANPGPGRNSSGRPCSDIHQTSKNILRCMSLNARSICNKLNEFHDLVIMKKVDVVAVTETWLHQGILDTDILDSNYIIFRRDRPQQQRGGGVLICVKSDCISVRRRDLENENVEAVVCELRGSNDSKLILAAFYRPPNMDSNYLHNVVDVLYNIHRTGASNIFILGDFNFPHVDWSNYSSSSNFDSIFIECLFDCFWSQLINSPTRSVNDSSTILDLLITSVPEFVRHITILSGEFSSDHMLITFDIISLKRIKPFKRYVYNYKDADFGGLQELLNYIPWDIAYDENYMDLSTVKWMDLFLSAVNDCVPKIEIKSANSAPWIDAEVLKAVRKKERLRKRAKNSSSEYHWAIFRFHRKELKSLIKWKRKQYFKGLSSTLTENP